jgi:dihydroorotate dehydrogenase electron transfer subunit
LIETLAIVARNELERSASTRRYGRLRLALDHPLSILPGQFAMLKPHASAEPLLRRAMACYRAGRGAAGIEIEFIYQILGRGTAALAVLREGDEVEFLGPLGNTFDLDAARGREALLVAGGVGSAGLYLLAASLRERGVPTRLFIGGASRGDLLGHDDFIELLGGSNVESAAIDGSAGTPGFVTAPLEAALAAGDAEGRIIYACGPEPMLHRVAMIAAARGLGAQLSLESPMACGFGICVGCAVAVRADCPEGFVYQKVCTDGPVFWSDRLHWESR